MAVTRTQIKEIVFDELETGTDALVDEEIEELSNKIADRLVAKIDDAYEDGSDELYPVTTKRD